MTGRLNDGHSSSVHPNYPSSLGLHMVLPCHRTGCEWLPLLSLKHYSQLLPIGHRNRHHRHQATLKPFSDAAVIRPPTL